MSGSPQLGGLARPSGGFAMVAIDQRESLRGMLASARDVSNDEVGDDQLVEFKVAATSTLSARASAMLMDVELAARPALAAGALEAGTGLIIAADRLIGPRGAAAEATAFDVTLDMAEWRTLGADAFKLMVFWGQDEDAAEREATTARFLESSRRAGLPAVLEVVVRPPTSSSDGSDLDEGIVAAARWASQMGPDLYKAQVPSRGAASVADARIIDCCGMISETLDCPWVVLSNGVRSEDFERAVRLACRGGASGFLAGRAVWADAVASPDWQAALRSVSVPRLCVLAEDVDEHCRPWTSVSGGDPTRSSGRCNDQ